MYSHLFYFESKLLFSYYCNNTLMVLMFCYSINFQFGQLSLRTPQQIRTTMIF